MLKQWEFLELVRTPRLHPMFQKFHTASLHHQFNKMNQVTGPFENIGAFDAPYLGTDLNQLKA